MPIRRPNSAVIGHSSRCVTCHKVMRVSEFILSWTSSTWSLGYLVLFDYDVSPNTYIALVSFIILRFLFVALGSCIIFYGMKQELIKVLA